MSNNYFRFKQFIVYQDGCAMKVCTDASLFGAWVANTIMQQRVKHNTILDIGCGTGLLSLMLAQKLHNANIDAVEIDKTAAMQAKENMTNSLWNEHFHIHHTPVQQYTSSIQYDFIITNPPFFKNNLNSLDKTRNIALHSAALTLEELIVSINYLLHKDGSFAVMLPHNKVDYFINLAKENNYYLQQIVNVKQTHHHHYFRSMMMFGKHQTEALHQSEIVIIKDGTYTAAFTGLLKDYYLYL